MDELRVEAVQSASAFQSASRLPFSSTATNRGGIAVQDVNVVGETVQHGSGQPLRPEDCNPFIEE